MKDLELLQLNEFQSKEPKIKQLFEKWTAERAERENGMTEEQVTLSRLQEQVKLYNQTPGELGFVNCLKCKNKGDIAYIKDGAEFHRRCECVKQRRSLKLIELSDVAKFLRDCTFEKFKTPEQWQKNLKQLCVDYTKKSKQEWLMLSGQTGSGKSHLCTAVVGEYLKRGYYCLYISFSNCITELKQLRFGDETKYHALLNSYQQCDLLYIDDLFYTKPTETDIDLAFQILDYRIKAGLKTIISTERSFKEIAEIRESAFGRIHQACGNYKIEIAKDTKKNYRLKGGA